MATGPADWPPPWRRTSKPPLNTRPLTPSSGAYYKVLFPSPRGNGRRITASQNSSGQAFFAVPWADALKFEIDALGFSDYTLGQKYLSRRLPLRHGDPCDTTLVLDSLDTISFHNFDKAVHESLTVDDGLYSAGWAKTQMRAYMGTFTQPSFPLVENAVVLSASVPELKRYCERTSETNVYHRKIPGWGVAFDSNLTIKCQVLASLPEYTIRLFYTTYRWPVEAVPEDAIANTLGCVNDDVFDPDKVIRKLDGSTQNGYPTEEVLYEDCRKGKPYHGADGTSDILYVDLQHVFLWNVKNWNKQINPSTGLFEYVQFVDSTNNSFSPVRRPYPKKDFRRIFWPAGAAP